MTTLADVRAKFPDYEGRTDGDLLLAINRKYYPHMHPRDFLSRIEGASNAHVTIKDPKIKAWFRESVSKPLPGESDMERGARLGGTSYGPTDHGGRGMAAARSALQGQTFGYGDELVGGVTAALTGNSPEFETARERRRLAQGETDFPGQSMGAEIGGAVAMPGAVVKSAPAAVAAGTAAGTAYASGKAEGGLEERSTAAIRELPSSLFFSAASVPAQRLLSRFARGKVKRPSADVLRVEKNAAYKAVDQSGFRFSEDEMLDLAAGIEKRLADPSSPYVRGDTVTERAFALIEKNLGGEKTISEVDALRSRLLKRWSRADGPEQDAIMDMVAAMDDLIETKAGASEVLGTAREAYKKYMRVDFLEAAFQKAADNTQVTGSAGNIYNNYGRVFKNILNDPKQRRMFTEEQQEWMRAAMGTTLPEDVARKIGKLSPDGNGLMLALTAIGGAIDPTLIAVGGAGAAAKMVADRKMIDRVDDILGIAGGVQPRAPIGTPTQLPGVAAVAGQQDF